MCISTIHYNFVTGWRRRTGNHAAVRPWFRPFCDADGVSCRVVPLRKTRVLVMLTVRTPAERLQPKPRPQLKLEAAQLRR